MPFVTFDDISLTFVEEVLSISITPCLCPIFFSACRHRFADRMNRQHGQDER